MKKLTTLVGLLALASCGAGNNQNSETPASGISAQGAICYAPSNKKGVKCVVMGKVKFKKNKSGGGHEYCAPTYPIKQICQ